MKIKKCIKSLVLLIVFIILILLLWWWRFLVMPITGAEPVRFILKPGNTAIRTAYVLENTTYLSHPKAFVLLARLRGDLHRLQGGEYELAPYSTSSDVLNQFIQGSDIYHAFIVVNGWTIYQVMAELSSNKNIKHTLNGKSLSEIAKAMGLNHKTPEGLLFPNTYFYRWGTSDVALLNRAHVAMQAYLKTAWADRAKGLPYRSPYQALIVASMIEKETAKTREKPVIAAVILARLKKWMHLQIDSTVIYGLMPNYQGGSLSRADLRQDTPFNSYLHYGLPPTPIAMPGPGSIEAALHPASTQALYYVAKGDGSHVFSNTLKGQQAAIRKYLLKAP
ncbi:MAG: hypothetical protein COV52_08075 [Gammaproteobacteria bacterium CG11_big_fil_rev_8_21_14_0_20_46_22]|nr:MAG: hypothetical protein COW05_00015 [Gammaproteobacteria bacterium CG12_big_fil_rev_8_21_14_0_65_46_12]PIR10621.1 MAG: hypothetical protein COV52_08075 [Gammaproteobacteria bacterium CG11_big_fil_rev_8_21_14_0_20_46_22]